MVTHVCVSKAGTTCSKKTNLFLIQNSSIPLQEMNICGIFIFFIIIIIIRSFGHECHSFIRGTLICFNL